ncbi:AAA family ATPase [Candidatus Peregrinibacteria bacterium]|nr:AAA family ATPase [Candidatus Peregrinibacteria bacterium]
MKITAIKIENVRGFQKIEKTSFSEKINILIGANNAGKSTILNSIFKLQRSPVLSEKDITIGSNEGTIELYFKGHHPLVQNNREVLDRFILYLHKNDRFFGRNDNDNLSRGLNVFPETEPNNLIYPYLSKRKVGKFSSQINENNTNTVSGNLSHLYSKIDRLVTPQFQPGNSQYIKACKDILGFEISSLAKGDGKEAVYFIHNQEHIPLTSMGEGVSSILGLITDLCIAENKIFIIEEPENDIHPRALKSLLNLIAEKSNSNQFFISTHSNIVMKNLGAVEDSKIFHVSNNDSDEKRPNLKKSTLIEVSNEPSERLKVLEELGYELFDFDLWKAWLFLEESSAEVIIRDYLIRWFYPNLKYKLRTFSAQSISRVEEKFEDFNKLFVFLHLEPTYKNKVWVYIDAGEKEEEIISKMQKTYETSGWKKTNFDQFSEHDFEKYYPKKFQTEVDQILRIKEKNKKREAKKKLLDDVKKWIEENEKEAKTEFEKSASEIISILKRIDANLG